MSGVIENRFSIYFGSNGKRNMSEIKNQICLKVWEVIRQQMRRKKKNEIERKKKSKKEMSV